MRSRTDGRFPEPAAAPRVASRPAALVLGLLLTWQAGCGAPERRRTAPDFELPRLEGGGTLSLSEFDGAYVLLNFWASWCAPCLEEIPSLRAVRERFAGRGLEVVGVTVNDLVEDSRAFARENGMEYPNVVGNDGLYESYGLSPWIPVTLLIGPDRRILYEWHGPQSTAEFLQGIATAAPELTRAAD